MTEPSKRLWGSERRWPLKSAPRSVENPLLSQIGDEPAGVARYSV